MCYDIFMKKIIIFIFCFLFINSVYGSTTIQKGTFSKCVDGDTAYFIVDGKEEKFRFLAIDTPETVSTTVSEEPFGKEASDFVCQKLSNAKEIVFEYESSKTDKYGRILAWIWIDGNLLQKEIIENGYGKVAYIYGNYEYTDSLCIYENNAKENKLNVWSQGSYKQGYCSKISTDSIEDNISYEEIKKSLNMLEKADETIKKLEKIDDKITSSLDENSDIIESILLYVIIALELIVTIIKEIKKK